jgi:hypothetical protein
MRITDPVMAAKMEKALRLGGNVYTLDDIENALASGEMQGHTGGNSWVITRVHSWPRRKSVDIVFAVGNIEDLPVLLKKVELWAKDQGADLITGTGRDGWFGHIAPSWKKIGVAYSKDLT